MGRPTLQKLASAIEEVQGDPIRKAREWGPRRRAIRAGSGEVPTVVATGWEAVDRVLGGGLRRGAVHEWLAEESPGGGWSPPLIILIHLARRALEQRGVGGDPSIRKATRMGTPDDAGGGEILWIGRRCWPYPPTLQEGPAASAASQRLQERSLFIDPPDEASRLWAIDLAARCPAVAAVIADGSGLDMPHSRRLQLAAEAGSALVLLARPAREVRTLSAASTRWRIESALIDESPEAPRRFPAWMLSLLRCKGMQPIARQADFQSACGKNWLLEVHDQTNHVHLAADVAHRPRQAPPSRCA